MKVTLSVTRRALFRQMSNANDKNGNPLVRITAERPRFSAVRSSRLSSSCLGSGLIVRSSSSFGRAVREPIYQAQEIGFNLARNFRSQCSSHMPQPIPLPKSIRNYRAWNGCWKDFNFSDRCIIQAVCYLLRLTVDDSSGDEDLEWRLSSTVPACGFAGLVDDHQIAGPGPNSALSTYWKWPYAKSPYRAPLKRRR